MTRKSRGSDVMVWVSYLLSSICTLRVRLFDIMAEGWTFAADERMAKGQMSGNEVYITEAERWYRDGVDDDKVEITSKHWEFVRLVTCMFRIP